MKFSEALVKIRKDNNMTQEEMAEQLNVTRQTVSKWESDLSVPDIAMVQTIAAFFDVSIDELMNGVKKKKEIKKTDLFSRLFTYIFLCLLFLSGFITFLVNLFFSGNQYDSGIHNTSVIVCGVSFVALIIFSIWDSYMHRK